MNTCNHNNDAHDGNLMTTEWNKIMRMKRILHKTSSVMGTPYHSESHAYTLEIVTLRFTGCQWLAVCCDCANFALMIRSLCQVTNLFIVHHVCMVSLCIHVCYVGPLIGALHHMHRCYSPVSLYQVRHTLRAMHAVKWLAGADGGLCVCLSLATNTSKQLLLCACMHHLRRDWVICSFTSTSPHAVLLTLQDNMLTDNSMSMCIMLCIAKLCRAYTIQGNAWPGVANFGSDDMSESVCT